MTYVVMVIEETKKIVYLNNLFGSPFYPQIALMRDEPRKANAKVGWMGFFFVCVILFCVQRIVSISKRCFHKQSIGSCICYCLERSDFEQLLGSFTGVIDMHIGTNLLRKVKEFQNMSEKEIETVAKALLRGSYEDGDHIIKQARKYFYSMHCALFHRRLALRGSNCIFLFPQGSNGDKFYILEKGFAKVVSDGSEVSILVII
jgi:hypothetical protein